MNNVRQFPSSKSAYMPFHNTDTGLRKAQSDTPLVMLDLSATLDTINRSDLFENLGTGFRVGGILKWFTSYV